MTRTKAWLSPGSGTGTSSNRKTSGPPKLWIRTAFILTDQSTRIGFESGQERITRAKEKPAQEYFPGGPDGRKTRLVLVERDTARFLVFCLWQSHRQNALFNPGRDLVGVNGWIQLVHSAKVELA